MRLNKKVFIDLLIKMLGFGTVVGIIFPFFALVFGVEKKIAYSPLFFISCILAGIFVGLISFFITKSSIKFRLLNLIKSMKRVDDSINEYREKGFSGSIDVREFTVIEESDDCFGQMADTFNELVSTLAETLHFQKGHRQYIESLSENLDLSQLSECALSALLELSGSSAGSVLIEKDGELCTTSSIGIKNPENLNANRLVLQVLRKGTREIIKFPENIILDGVLTDYKPLQIIIEPIIFNGINSGVLILASVSEIQNDFLEQLDILMKSFAVILNNSIQHERMQKLAAIDPLTGIYNRRFGMNRLTEECARSTRFNSPLGIIMFDIDKFKMVNDTYGHIAGDRIIKRIVTETQNILRNGDILIRYGGEEFLLILPGANKDNAFRVAERIRYAVEQSVTEYGENQIKVTVSLGIDAYPESSMTDPMELVKNADRALYNAKTSGRNRSIIS
ncbi:MAG TPA: GGDEF domain-containing protein [Bacteroidales bacterium]|nr:GGDEF domain-containing protein [Bacteroidales bacterium]